MITIVDRAGIRIVYPIINEKTFPEIFKEFHLGKYFQATIMNDHIDISTFGYFYTNNKIEDYELSNILISKDGHIKARFVSTEGSITLSDFDIKQNNIMFVENFELTEKEKTEIHLVINDIKRVLDIVAKNGTY